MGVVANTRNLLAETAERKINMEIKEIMKQYFEGSLNGADANKALGHKGAPHIA